MVARAILSLWVPCRAAAASSFSAMHPHPLPSLPSLYSSSSFTSSHHTALYPCPFCACRSQGGRCWHQPRFSEVAGGVHGFSQFYDLVLPLHLSHTTLLPPSPTQRWRKTTSGPGTARGVLLAILLLPFHPRQPARENRTLAFPPSPLPQAAARDESKPTPPSIRHVG